MKTGLESYRDYLELRWQITYRDSIVEDHLVSDLRHSCYRTYFRPLQEVLPILLRINLEELVTLALFELSYIAEMSGQDWRRVLPTWIEINGRPFLQAFKPLCPEAESWTKDDLQTALERKLALETSDVAVG